MSRTLPFVVAVLILAALALAAAAREILEVNVLNFPDPQRIRGTVTIENPMPHGTLVRFQDLIVPPVKPTDTTRLVSGGSLDASGFTQVVLSLSGITKGDVVKGGAAGAILVPDEETIVRTFVEAGQVQFPLEVTASGVSGASGYFASRSERLVVGFPRYRVLLWNTADKSVTVNLYAYLTN
jgi:hypothetical protein